jgi:hypothetical protein
MKQLQYIKPKILIRILKRLKRCIKVFKTYEYHSYYLCHIADDLLYDGKLNELEKYKFTTYLSKSTDVQFTHNLENTCNWPLWKDEDYKIRRKWLRKHIIINIFKYIFKSHKIQNG